MSIILPPGTDKQDEARGATVIEFPSHCREYLGKTWGFCPDRGTNRIDKWLYCDHHYAARFAFYDEPIGGRA